MSCGDDNSTCDEQSPTSDDLIFNCNIWNSSDDHHSTSMKHLDYALLGVVVSLLTAFGCVGNTLAIFVFSRPRRWPCINYYLLSLALWDTALLLSSFLLYSLPTLLYNGMPTIGTYVIVYPYFYVFSNVASTGSVWIVVVLTVERFLAIYRPLQHRTIMNNHARVRTILIIMSLTATAYNVPRIFDLQLVDCLDQYGTAQKQIEPTELYFNWWFHVFYKIVGGMLFIFLGPFIVLSALSIFICKEVRAAMSASNKVVLKMPGANGARNSTTTTTVALRRTGMPSCRRQQRTNANAMSLIVVTKFLLCYFTANVVEICEWTMTAEQFDKLSSMVTFSNVSVVLNSSCNFLIYFAFGQTFRQCLLRCLRRALAKVFDGGTLKKLGFSSFEEENSVVVSYATSTQRRISCAPTPITTKRSSYSSIHVNQTLVNSNKLLTNKSENSSDTLIWV